MVDYQKTWWTQLIWSSADLKQTAINMNAWKVQLWELEDSEPAHWPL